MQGSWPNWIQHPWYQNSDVEPISSQGWNCQISFEVFQIEISTWCTGCSFTCRLQIIFKSGNWFHMLPYVNTSILEIHSLYEICLPWFQNWFPCLCDFSCISPLWYTTKAPLKHTCTSIPSHMLGLQQTSHIFSIVCLFTQKIMC